MGDKRKNDKKRLKGLTTQSISMTAFLMRILGVHNREIINEELTHQELAKIFPDLKRTSYDHILDDPRLVYSGQVALVRDATNAVIPYIISNQMRHLNDLGMNDVMDSSDWDMVDNQYFMPEEKTETPDIHDYDLKSMSIYDLEQLLKIYSATKQTGNYQIVRREIVSRKDSIQGTRTSRAKVRRKEKKYQKKIFDEYGY